MFHSILETTVAGLLKLSGCEIIKNSSEPPLFFDFGIKTKDGKKVALEVKRDTSPPILERLGRDILPRVRKEGYEAFWIVSPTKPLPLPVAFISSDAPPLSPLVLSFSELAKKLGVEQFRDIDFESWDTRVKLHELRESMESGTATERAVIMSDENQRVFGLLLDQLSSKNEFIGFSPQQLYERLGFDKRHERVVVVISDLKGFTPIVQAAEPELLNEMLTKYYAVAHRLVGE
ncbi:MAG: hypothetical protein HY360_10145 [Verrucomicrobia bacterium]|nr:hypothetical protein [Verrucomicrobiota bacterium]